MTHDLWSALNDHIFTFLSGVTLAQLVKQQQPSDVTVLQDRRPAAPKVPETV
jgi:Rrf2 family iron-sulfur cluster assembly transcriptional regulator